MAGRPKNRFGKGELLLRKTLRETITAEQYQQVIESLIDLAITSRNHNARVAAIKIIVERVEGPLPVSIQTEENKRTINDILSDADGRDS